MEMPLEQVKLVVIDIDGTLLNPQKQITRRTHAAIQAARAESIIVTLATARRYGNTKPVADELGIDIPLITYDGALLMHHPRREVVHAHPLAADIAQQAVNILSQYHVQPIVHQMNENVEETWSGLEAFDNPELAGYFAVFPDVYRLSYDELCQDKPDPLRVVGFAQEKTIAQVVPDVARLDCAWYTIKRGSYGCAEICVMDTLCSKASGVIALARHLGIPLEQVMALGDNINDVEMLQAVGWGVAMGQSSETVRSIAHAVTTSNAEDGVAVAIERYALRDARYSDSNSFKRSI